MIADADLRTVLNSTDWFHRFPIRGEMTSGTHDVVAMWNWLNLRDRDISGKRVLDVGANDGYFSFECEQRGAARVVALDHPHWGMAGYGISRRKTFDLAHEALSSKVQPIEAELATLEPADLSGPFDLILFLGVLYHLPDPVSGLKKIADLAAPGALLVIETHVDMLDVPRPAAAFYPGEELNRDVTNWWGFNPPAVTGLLKSAGFRDGRIIGSPIPYAANSGMYGGRAVFHANR
jgi:tRNA (mo5U34)-methyltransferase